MLLSLIGSRLQKLLKHISIRRMKSDEDEGKPLVNLPPRTVVIQEVELSQEERELYDAMQNHGQLVIGRLEAHVFSLFQGELCRK